MSVVKTVCKAMERLAPLRLAAKWDNVGLLLESPFQKPNANNVLLTIDLTPSVLTEALTSSPSPTSLIISYHPPLFKPPASFTLANPLQSSLLQCAAHGISVYSPHSALDSTWGGINDWLAEGVLSGGGGAKLAGDVCTLAGEKLDVGMENELKGGEGRMVKLQNPIEMKELENRIMRFLNLPQIQVGYAAPPGRGRPVQGIRTVAICAGSGGSMLLGQQADVYLTGEMSHHEVLAAEAAGTHVILCGHTNTERGYLPLLASKLRRELASDLDGAKSIEVRVSREDKHPLQFVQLGSEDD